MISCTRECAPACSPAPSRKQQPEPSIDTCNGGNKESHVRERSSQEPHFLAALSRSWGDKRAVGPAVEPEGTPWPGPFVVEQRAARADQPARTLRPKRRAISPAGMEMTAPDRNMMALNSCSRVSWYLQSGDRVGVGVSAQVWAGTRPGH